MYCKLFDVDNNDSNHDNHNNHNAAPTATATATTTAATTTCSRWEALFSQTCWDVNLYNQKSLKSMETCWKHGNRFSAMFPFRNKLSRCFNWVFALTMPVAPEPGCQDGFNNGTHPSVPTAWFVRTPVQNGDPRAAEVIFLTISLVWWIQKCLRKEQKKRELSSLANLSLFLLGIRKHRKRMEETCNLYGFLRCKTRSASPYQDQGTVAPHKHFLRNGGAENIHLSKGEKTVPNCCG